MRRIPTKIHGIFDYVIGALLIAIPWIMGYGAIGGPETWVPIGVGAVVIAYSMATDYELGVVQRLDMRAHLWLDGLAGATLLLSLVYFGYYDQTLWTPYIVLGVLLVVVAFTTRRKRREHRSSVERVER